MGLHINPGFSKMKTALVLLAAVAAAKSFNPRSFTYGFCEGAEQPLTIEALTVLPDPLVLATGAEITLQVLINLLEEVPPGTQAKVSIKKDALIDIPIPCIPLDGISIGTCDYDVQELLNLAADFLCPTYVPEGQACSLPLGPGMYGGQDPLTVVLGDLPSLIVDLIASGTYKAVITIVLPDGSEMTCIEGSVDISGH